MAIKRQGQNPRRSVAKAEVPPEVPAVSSAKPPVRAKRAPAKPRIMRSSSPEPETYQSGTLLSREEKRQIILAHANQRKPHDPVQIMSMWAGVAACLLVVAGGWWWTVRPELGRGFASIKPAMAQSTDELKSASQLFKDLSQSGLLKPLDSINSKLSESQAKLKAQKDALDAVSSLVNTDATGGDSSKNRDIFAPTTALSTSTVPTTDNLK